MSYRDAVMAAKYAGGPVEQATTLHEERFEAVARGEGYFGFDRPRGVVVHVVPNGVYDDGYAIDLAADEVLPEADPSRPAQLPVLGASGVLHGTWTADGFGASEARESRESKDERTSNEASSEAGEPRNAEEAIAESAPERGDRDGCAGYAHLFSNGVVESAAALPLSESSRDEHPRLDGRAFELELTRCVRRYLRVLAYHRATAPIHVAVTAYGTGGCRLDPGEDGPESAELREDVIAPFPVTVENFDADVRTELADPLGAFWRAAGYPESPFYSDGAWELRSAFEESR